MTLTGRTRHRADRQGFFGTKLVLQVEFSTANPGDHYQGDKAWRDATVEDLAELVELGKYPRETSKGRDDTNS